MGNQGTKNWKFSAFFAISLMLIAGLFSNAAIAASGDGTAVLTTGTPSAGAENAAGTGFIPAGMNNYKMEFTFTLATDEVASMADGEVQIKFPTGWTAASAGEDFAPQAIAGSTTTNLLVGTRFSGASVIIPLTKGTGDAEAANAPATVAISFGVNVPAMRKAHTFTVLSKSKNGRFTALSNPADGEINVRVGPRDSIAITPARVLGGHKVDFSIAYTATTASDGVTVEVMIPQGWTVPDTKAGDSTANAHTNVTIDGRVIKFNADGTDAAASPIALTFTTPNLPGSYEFTTKSKSANGSLTKLDDHDGDGTTVTDPQPDVMVGNVAPGMGTVAITPSAPIEGDRNVEFTITFTAAGRMITDSFDGNDPATPDDPTDDTFTDRAGIRIAFPFAIAAEDIKSVTGGGVQTANYSVSTPNLDIVIPHLNKGQKIVIMTNPIDLTTAITQPTANPADEDLKTSFGAVVETTILADGTTSATALTYAAANSLTNAGDDAMVTGGLVKAATDPGELTVSPMVVERGKEKQSITITYKALRTHFATDVIKISLPDTIAAASIGKGANLTPSAGTTLTHAAESHDIRWSLTSQLNRGSSVKVSVQINVPDSTEDLVVNYITAVDPDAAAAVMGTSAKITVVGKAGDVRVEVVDLDNGNPLDPSFPAASKQAIGFRFTAVNTSIEADGYFRITLPSNWAPTSRTGSTSSAKVKIAKAVDAAGADISEKLPTNSLSAGGRVITVRIDDGTTKNMLPKGGSITVQYGENVGTGKDYRAMMPRVAGDQMIRAEFKAYTGLTEYDLPSITAKVTRVADGSGTARITPSANIRAGSSDKKIEVTFTAQGAMGGGAVRLTIPAGWGPMQGGDAAAKNHIAVRSSIKDVKINTDSLVDGIVVADLPGGDDNLNAFKSGNTLTFVFGGAPGGLGAQVQNDIGVASFTIESDGDGDGGFGALSSTTAVPASNPMGLGQIYMGADGALKVDVVSGADGSGTAKVDIVSTSVGMLRYDGPNNAETYQIHAADAVQLKFTYTATQRIQDGQLRLTIPIADGWTSPQDLTTGDKGYTRVEAPAGAVQEPTLSSSTVTVDVVDLSPDDTIVIYYGDGSSMVDAPSDIGLTRFAVSIKGSATGSPENLDTDPLTLNVRSQASGAGTATANVTGDALHAGDMDRELQIVYTAAGQMSGGEVKLTIPKAWSDPEGMEDMDHNLEVTPAGVSDEVVFDADDSGNHTVLATDVDLAAGGSLTFRYSMVMVQPTRGTAQFTVAVDGGDQPSDDADGTVAIADLSDLVVEVEAARAGSGTATISPSFVDAGGDEATLAITYTAAGDIFYPSTVMVEVPASWDQPTSGDRATDEGRHTVAGATERPPQGRKMVARVTQGSPVAAGGTITFTYNANPPTRPEISMFKVYFDGAMIEMSPELAVQPEGGATQLAIGDVADLSADADEQMPVMVTVMLQGDDGSSATAEAAVEVMLDDGASTGMFSMTEDGEYGDTATITIAMGMWEGMAYYKNSMLGSHTITASATGYDSVMTTVMVSTAVAGLTSVDFTVADSDGVVKTGASEHAAMDGDMIAVTAMANRDQAVTVMIGTVTAARANMEESTTTPGTYTRSHTLAAGSPEDSHTITVYSGTEMMSATDMLIVDNTMPTVTASASPAMVANGEEVMISAMVSDGTGGSGLASVMANVSMLDTEATAMVTLTDDDGDGTYTGMHDISTANTAANGDHTITVTAMDNAGNSGSDTATVELRNAVSYTSMIPSGVSLFHVPLDAGLATVGDLKAALGDNIISIIAHRGGTDYDADSDDVAITGDLGLILVTSGSIEHKFEGSPWGGGSSMITLAKDANLIGLPLDVDGVDMVSDIFGLFDEGVVLAITIASNGDFPRIDGPNDPDDTEVKGDAAYLVIASAAGTAMVDGAGWDNNGGASAAPIALSGYQLDTQTPLVSVYGSVTDEITGLAREGFHVKVKNLTTKAALSEITSVEAADGYSMTFVDLADAHAARVGDVLEISADSPDPLVGVKPVRHIVTVDDVKNSLIQLEALIAYEIPAETELLRNYPNPFNPETWIPYRLAEDADVSLTIYDVNGELVRSIDLGHQTAAVYETRTKAIYWDGRNQFGEQVASGIYFYNLSAGDDFSATRKMVILK